jgi:hypothetical protein
LIERHHQGIIEQRSFSIVGPKHAQVLNFLEWAAISTTILTKGYMEVGGEFWGEKRVGLKPLLPTYRAK